MRGYTQAVAVNSKRAPLIQKGAPGKEHVTSHGCDRCDKANSCLCYLSDQHVRVRHVIHVPHCSCTERLRDAEAKLQDAPKTVA